MGMSQKGMPCVAASRQLNKCTAYMVCCVC